MFQILCAEWSPTAVCTSRFVSQEKMLLALPFTLDLSWIVMTVSGLSPNSDKQVTGWSYIITCTSKLPLV